MGIYCKKKKGERNKVGTSVILHFSCILGVGRYMYRFSQTSIAVSQYCGSYQYQYSSSLAKPHPQVHLALCVYGCGFVKLVDLITYVSYSIYVAISSQFLIRKRNSSITKRNEPETKQ